MVDSSQIKPRYRSATYYILLGLVPYSDPNIKLVFKPSQFFRDLERIDHIKQNTARNAFYRAQKQGLIKKEDGKPPSLTSEGLRKVQPYISKKLKGSKIMITFDIPESEGWKRRQFRSLLRELSCKQVQKSVWITQNDHRKILLSEIQRLQLESCVNLYECRPISAPSS